MPNPKKSTQFYYIFITFISFFFTISTSESKAQLSYNVLFLGNSYTGVNNLPQLIHDVALSAGDTLIFDSHTPGGYRLADHYNDATSQSKIMTGGWDYVVIQGQSQESAVSTSQFYNGANALYNLIKQNNSCAVVMPYMTWGRKNGDAANCLNFPVVCTYEGMDSTIRNNYLYITNSMNSEVSPVSIVWKYLRQNHPAIELYEPDESHPSAAGSYAAACSFYASIFKKDPTLITFNFGLNPADADLIKMAAKTQVFDNLQLWDFKMSPIANIQYQIGTGVNEIIFNGVNPGIRQTYLWDFGDGFTASNSIETHSYLTNGTYTVSLTTSTCDLQGLQTSYADTVIQFCSHSPGIYTLNSWVCYSDTLWTQPADSYQWFALGVPIPETNQFIANYVQYANSGFAVMTTLNGCTELSELYTNFPDWSGYYFDGIGDPCVGDTVEFAVLHLNGFLSGSETILWFKNDTLLPLMTNEDTLLITTSGKYECKVIDPNSICPLDTTNSVLEYNCGVVGIPVIDQTSFWSLYPNPASESLTINFTNYSIPETIHIYNTIGKLVRSIFISSTTTKINIDDLPDGLYYLILQHNNHPPLKFIKHK